MIQTDLSSFSYKKGSLLPWCKKCGAENFYRDGKNKQGIQKYECRNCGFRFVWTSDLPRRNYFSDVMTFAVELYTSLRVAASYRGIKIILEKIFRIQVSHETIRQWVLQSKTGHFIDDKMNNLQTWHADETYIKIKGEGHWLWIIYSKETKQVLAWNISKQRFYEDAKLVLQNAKQTTGGRPKKIITDGLYQYAAAIKKVMGWKWNIHLQKHIIDSGIGKNAFIERLNREIKRRTKWFSTFQTIEGATTFFNLWFNHYNTHALT